MNSLRARLIVGFSLVAVLPLVLALLLMGQRIQHTVDSQAAARLETAVGMVRQELDADGARLRARLALLARTPELKRLFLVGGDGGPELREYLAAQRFLLGLDHLAITDTRGRPLADAANVPGAPGAREALEASALPAASDTGVAIVALAGLPALALDARVAIAYQGASVGWLRGGMRLDSLFLARLARTSGLELVLRDARGAVLAGTLAGALPPAAADPGSAPARVSVGRRTYLARDVALAAAPDARLTVLASTSTADEALATLRWSALALGLLGVGLAVALGLAWSRALSRPVERLAAFSERIARGEWDEPLAPERVRELGTLVEALEQMRADLRRYRENLRVSERQAAYGQMARKVAHEIKNPLTPIALSVEGLQRAFDQGRPDFPVTLAEAVRTVGTEVERLKQLLREFSELGRFPAPRPARFDVRELLGELGALLAHEVASGRLVFEPAPDPVPLLADRDQLRQAVLNLVQNALDATAGSDGRVRVAARVRGGATNVTVSDDGPGLGDEQRAQLFVPGFTTKAHGSGLGLTIVERIVSDHGGVIEVESAPGRGTTFTLRFAPAGEA